MLSVNFRPMQKRDLPAVYRLERACQPMPWPMWCFRSMLRSHASCWVLEQEDELLGFGILKTKNHKAHIMNMCVAPAHQRKGLGRRIMLHLLAVAKHKHARYAWLEVRTTNLPAILLYRQLGFRAKSIRKHYYVTRRGRQNAIIMVRKVN